MAKLFPLKEQKKTKWAVAKNNSNEIEWVFSTGFLAYKSFVSSQDGTHCTFHPSCSVYALESIKKNGAIIGAMDTFDRLVRCNGLSPEWYPFDRKKKLLIDKP
ncbi:MAG: membrane protein insertion efficiency factor YidD [Bacteroidota bacterium]